MTWIYLLFLFMALVAVVSGEYGQVPRLLLLTLAYLMLNNIQPREEEGHETVQQGYGNANIPLSVPVEETSQDIELEFLTDYFRRLGLEDGVVSTTAEGGQSLEAQGLEADSSYNLPASEPVSLQGTSGSQAPSLPTSNSTETTRSMMADSQTDSELPPGVTNPNYNKLKERIQELERGIICRVCLDSPRDTVFRPCCHFATCTPCARVIMDTTKTCCVCREDIHEYDKVYIP